MTITGKTFTNLVTITCDKSKTDDGFGGDIRFRNCNFEKGVTVQLAAGVNYNIRLENCTGAFTVTAEDSVKGADRTGVNFFGDLGGVTVNGLTISGIDGWQDEEYNINARYDECGGGGNTPYISTVEVVNRRDGEDNIISISGSNYTGKLRIGGNIDISGVTMADNSGQIELAAHQEEEHPEWSDPGHSEIKLGSNKITIGGDCSGDHSFTGTGTVLVFDRNDKVNLTINDKRLGAPHIFGSGNYGIYLGLTDISDVGFAVKQNGTVLPHKAVRYDKSEKADGSEEFDGNNVEKTHLEKGDGNWITDVPNNIRLEVTVGGCTAVYDPLHVKGE